MKDAADHPASHRSSPVWLRHTLIALVVGVVHLILLRGPGIAVFLLFGLPPLVALALFDRSRLVAAFLALIFAGTLIAPFPKILPAMGGVDRRLPVEADRLLTWYFAVYIFFFLGLIPIVAFVSQLRRHRHNEPALLSRFTCRFGVLTWLLVLPGVIHLSGGLIGFWRAPWMG